MDSSSVIVLAALGYLVWRDRQRATAGPGGVMPPAPWYVAPAGPMPPTSTGVGNLGSPITPEQVEEKQKKQAKNQPNIGHYVAACTTLAGVGGAVGVIGGPVGMGIGAGAGCLTGAALEFTVQQGWIK